MGYFGYGFAAGGFGPPPDVHTPPDFPSPLQTPPLRWQWVTGDWRTGPSTAIRPQNRSVTWRLTGRSEASFTLDGRDPAAATITELIDDLWIVRQPQVGTAGAASTIFRGRIGSSQDAADSDKHTVTFSVGDYRAVLDRRHMWENDQQVWNHTDQAAVAWGLITQTQAQPGGNLGIVRGEGKTTGVLRDPSFPKGKFIGEAIDELSFADNGFNWDISPDKDPSNPALYLDVFYPSRGIDRRALLDYGGRVFAFTRNVDPGEYGNAVRGTGKDGLTPVRRDAAGIATAPEGRWDTAMADVDLQTQQTVIDRTVRDLAVKQIVTPTWTVALKPNTWLGPEDVWLGDPVRLAVKSGRLNVFESLQVQEVTASWDNSDVVTALITLGPVTAPNRRWALRKVNQRLAALERR